MITLIWIATLIILLGSIELLARAATTEASIELIRADARR